MGLDDLEAGLNDQEIDLYSEIYKRSHGPTVSNILDFQNMHLLVKNQIQPEIIEIVGNA